MRGDDNDANVLAQIVESILKEPSSDNLKTPGTTRASGASGAFRADPNGSQLAGLVDAPRDDLSPYVPAVAAQYAPPAIANNNKADYFRVAYLILKKLRQLKKSFDREQLLSSIGEMLQTLQYESERLNVSCHQRVEKIISEYRKTLCNLIPDHTQNCWRRKAITVEGCSQWEITYYQQLEKLMIQEFQTRNPPLLEPTKRLDCNIAFCPYSDETPAKEIFLAKKNAIVYVYDGKDYRSTEGETGERSVFLYQYPRDLFYCPSVILTAINLIACVYAKALPVEAIKFYPRNDPRGNQIMITFCSREAARQFMELYRGCHLYTIFTSEGFYIAKTLDGVTFLKGASEGRSNAPGSTPPSTASRFELLRNSNPTTRQSARFLPRPSYCSQQSQNPDDAKPSTPNNQL